VERNRLRLERAAGPRDRAQSRNQIRGGDVILLHDGGHKQMGADRSQTVIATDRLITRYKSEGYEFVTVPQMMQKDDDPI
jgi:peptidoglycan-N-acetylglucosamine deacetylase